MRKPANFYKTRYGWIWHRIKGDEARGGLFLHFEAWCGAYLPFSDIDHPFDPKPEFSDMPPGVCRRCEEAALKFGAQPSGLPIVSGPRYDRGPVFQPSGERRPIAAVIKGPDFWGYTRQVGDRWKAYVGNPRRLVDSADDYATHSEAMSALYGLIEAELSR